MEHKEDKKRNKGGRPKKGAIGKMTYHFAVKMAVGERRRLFRSREELQGGSGPSYIKSFTKIFIKRRLIDFGRCNATM